MIKEHFIAQYVINFMASWSASRYDDACLSGNQESLEQQPIEDAIYLAEIAWTKYQENI